MFLPGRNIILRTFKPTSLISVRTLLKNNHIKINEEVRFALETRQPIVALESTIITHGMPYPENVKCALEVEKIVRQQVSAKNHLLFRFEFNLNLR